jgi:hypothetical protein
MAFDQPFWVAFQLRSNMEKLFPPKLTTNRCTRFCALFTERPTWHQPLKGQVPNPRVSQFSISKSALSVQLATPTRPQFCLAVESSGPWRPSQNYLPAIPGTRVPSIFPKQRPAQELYELVTIGRRVIGILNLRLAQFINKYVSRRLGRSCAWAPAGMPEPL